MTNELKNYTFAPKAPTTWKTNLDEWLSSLDIESNEAIRKYSCLILLAKSLL